MPADGVLGLPHALGPIVAEAAVAVRPVAGIGSVRAWMASASAWMSRSLARRFVVTTLGLLLVIQLASFFVVDASLHRHAYRALPEQLAMGTRSLQRLIDWRADKLVESARLLAADFGFRSAVLTNDRETVASVLSNHGERIGADGVALLGTDLAVVAVADGNSRDGVPGAASIARLAARAAAEGGASEIAVIGGGLRQIVLVPMKAPMLVGWVLVAFTLPAAVADEVHTLSATDVTLLSRTRPDAPWVVALSRLKPALAAELAREMGSRPSERALAEDASTRSTTSAASPAMPTLATTMSDLHLGGRRYVAHALRLASASGQAGPRPEVLALLTVSVDEAFRPPRDLQIALGVTSLLGLLAFAISSAWTARRITTPLQSLAAAAERLGSGDYVTPIRCVEARGAPSHDEVHELAHAFEQMRISVASKQEQIVQSEKLASIGQLAAGVAHEINNPIGFVFSNFGTLEDYIAKLFEMLAAYRAEEAALAGTPGALRLERKREEIELDYLQEDIPALMSESKDGIKRVRKIVQDLKDFSHVDARQQWEFVDLHTGLDSTLNIVGNEIKYKADVVKEYGALPEVECLPGELNQVFMNLLVNAAHAIGDRRGTITLRSGVAGGEAWVEVADTGCGIAPADLKRIFDPFFTTKPVGKGTGLGLSLSYGIVKKHGGRIEVASEPGRGSSFRVTVPLRRVASP